VLRHTIKVVTLIDGLDANRGDIRELRHEMQLGFARIDSRFDHLEELWVEKGLREQTRFFLLAWGVLLAAIIGIYAR